MNTRCLFCWNRLNTKFTIFMANVYPEAHRCCCSSATVMPRESLLRFARFSIGTPCAIVISSAWSFTRQNFSWGIAAARTHTYFCLSNQLEQLTTLRLIGNGETRSHRDPRDTTITEAIFFLLLSSATTRARTTRILLILRELRVYVNATACSSRQHRANSCQLCKKTTASHFLDRGTGCEETKSWNVLRAHLEAINDF